MQPQVKSTKFFEYACCQVLPQLPSVEEADNQNRLLKVLAECALSTGEVANGVAAADNIYERLLDYVPKPPVDAAVSPDTVPDFEFTKAECLLIAYHSMGKQLPQTYFTAPEKEEAWKEFRVRQYSLENLTTVLAVNDFF